MALPINLSAPTSAEDAASSWPLAGQVRSRGTFGVDRFDAVFIAAIALCFLFVARLPFSASRYGDLDFHPEAKALAGAIRGAYPWSDVEIMHAPGPVLYYAVPYVFLTPGSADYTYWKVAFSWNILWIGVSGLLIRRAAALLAGELAGKIAALIFLFTPFWAYYSFGINGESVAFLSTALSAYAWACWQLVGIDARTRWRAGALLSLGLCLFLLSKPSGSLLVVFAFAAMVTAYTRGSRQYARSLFAWVALALLLLAAATSVTRLTTRGSAGAPQSALLRWVMFQGSFQFRTEPWDWRAWDHIRRQGSADYDNFVEQHAKLQQQSIIEGTPVSDLQWHWVVNDTLRHPVLRLKMSAVRVLALNVFLVNSLPSTQFHVGPLRGRVVYTLFHIALNILNISVLMAASWFLLARPKQFLQLWPLWGAWMALLIFHSAIYAEPRYLFAGSPGLIVLASAAITPRAQLSLRSLDEL
jgi:hypothetical protein